MYDDLPYATSLLGICSVVSISVASLIEATKLRDMIIKWKVVS